MEVKPAQVTLDGKRSYRQFVVTGWFDGQARDLTHQARFAVSDDRVVKVSHARASAAGDGQATLTISAGNQSVRVPVTVANTTRPDPVRFKFETLPLLTKQGCASGSCHGSPHGKGNFSLSLFGYDPRLDRISLTRDGFNRRINVIEPAESLMLKKPLLELSHVGGKRLRRGQNAHSILLAWIAEGAHVDLPSVECVAIEIDPGRSRILHAPHLDQQLAVLARFSDGQARDVTAIATYETSHPSIASVSDDGFVTGKARGQAAISIRYLDKLESVYVTVIEDVPGFAWTPPAQNNFIDRLVDDKLRQLQYVPSETCTDEAFVRRVHLDLTGLLPTAAVVRAFLGDKSPDKRQRLITELLRTEEYARFWALKDADLMRVSPKTLKGDRADLFAGWIVDAVRKNLPYDKFARQILTAAGDSRQVAAANYFLAIPTIQDRTEMTAQIFMGSRLECAKCHNHPFENWTMGDYYSLSAVFARTKAEDGVVKLVSTGEALHPASQQAMTPWGQASSTRAAPDADRRVPFTDWLTRKGNPFFARVAVNRIWAHLVGRGIVDPVDDFRSSNPPSNVPLLDALAAEFERSGYDRKRIIQLICESRTYQRSTQKSKLNETDDSLFSHARVRLLGAEQIKDAVALATHSQPPPSAFPAQLVGFQKQAAARRAALETDHVGWLVPAAAKVAQMPLWLGGWYMAGPFHHENMDEALKRPYPPEGKPVNLAEIFDGNRWELQPEFRDGGDNLVGEGNNLVHYLTRRIHSQSARPLAVTVQPKQGALLWLNGQLVTPDALHGKKKLTLQLQAGNNELVMKIANADQKTSFRFQTDKSIEATGKVQDDGMPPHVVEVLAMPAPRRTDNQRRLLRDYYLDADRDFSTLRQKVTRLEKRMEYATQRPYPEATPFMLAFGQPQRSTACTCERSNAPTLRQALELLNGDVTHEAARVGAAHYAKLDNQAIVDELYLAAYSRWPTDKERASARKFLDTAPSRDTAVMDLVWTVINTQEFLFQH